MVTAVGIPGDDEYGSFYAGYVAQVGVPDVLAFLREQRQRFLARLSGVPPEKRCYRYSPGKWSIQEVIGHVADAERVFGYRALRIARGDTTPLAGFDEKPYVAVARFEEREYAGLVEELDLLRRANLALLEGLDAEAWQRRGTASGAPVTVRAQAYILGGHLEHHLQVLRERYGL